MNIFLFFGTSFRALWHRLLRHSLVLHNIVGQVETLATNEQNVQECDATKV